MTTNPRGTQGQAGTTADLFSFAMASTMARTSFSVDVMRGVLADVHGTPIKVTVLYPGYIVSEMSGTSAKTPLMASTEKGVRAMVEAIEKEKKSAVVPAWPWVPLGFVVKRAPVGLLRRMA